MTASGLITPVRAPHLPSNGHYYQPLSPLSEYPVDPMKKPKKIALQLTPNSYCTRSETYATSFCRQLSLLLMRTSLVIWRDRSLTAMRLFIHVMIAILIGTLYYGIGDDATNVFNIFRYIFFSIMFLMFTGKITSSLICARVFLICFHVFFCCTQHSVPLHWLVSIFSFLFTTFHFFYT